MYRSIVRFARAMAFAGGLVLSALILITCISIIGRTLSDALNSDFMQSGLPGLSNALLGVGIGPIRGDVEMVEAGMAFTIFAFLPLCQITGAHAAVDIFTARLPDGVNRALRMVIDILFAAVLMLIAVQLYGGTMSKVHTGQTSFLLEFPIWWPYALSLIGAVAAALVSVYIALVRIAETVRGRDILPPDLGAEH